MSDPPRLPSLSNIHTAADGSEWVNIGGQWVRYDTQVLLNQMDVDSPRLQENPYPPTQLPPIHGHRVQEQYDFSMRPVSAGPPAPPRASSSRVPEPPVASTSRIPDSVIDPRLRRESEPDPAAITVLALCSLPGVSDHFLHASLLHLILLTCFTPPPFLYSSTLSSSVPTSMPTQRTKLTCIKRSCDRVVELILTRNRVISSLEWFGWRLSAVPSTGQPLLLQLQPAKKVGGVCQVDHKGKKRACESDPSSESDAEQPPAKHGRPHAAGKKKSVIVSSDTEVEEIAPVVAPRTRIDRAAERLSEAEQRLADVERENRDLRQLVRELRDKVHRSSEGSSRLAQFVTGLIGFQSGQEEEMLWMGDAMAESRRITEDFRRREGGQGGLGLTTEEKEEAEKKKKRAEVDALADTDGGSEKSDDAEDLLKVKEEKMDKGESWGEEFRRACGCTPPVDTEVIVNCSWRRFLTTGERIWSVGLELGNMENQMNLSEILRKTDGIGNGGWFSDHFVRP
ncbi:hypothetical protein B0H19DRAFT_1252635 [Mycena capillaripes]|nr:hypothetical protein B0H19DRAFT_1252635 [Mycena capillaripes]